MALARRRSVLLGGGFALASALAFGATTPLVQRAGRGVGPFTTPRRSSTSGSALFAVPPVALDATRPSRGGTSRARRDLVTLFGALLAPVMLAWGLQHTSGVGRRSC